MNQTEIEFTHRLPHGFLNVRKAVNLLHSLMQSVNEQSDGWAYWHPPSRASKKLVELLRGVNAFYRPATSDISDAELRKAISPIKAMVTRETKRQARFGNKFSFDVEAALKERSYE